MTVALCNGHFLTNKKGRTMFNPQLDRQSVYDRIMDAHTIGYAATISSDPQERAGGAIAMGLASVGLAIMYLADKLEGPQVTVPSEPEPESQPPHIDDSAFFDIDDSQF